MSLCHETCPTFAAAVVGPAGRERLSGGLTRLPLYWASDRGPRHTVTSPQIHGPRTNTDTHAHTHTHRHNNRPHWQPNGKHKPVPVGQPEECHMHQSEQRLTNQVAFEAQRLKGCVQERVACGVQTSIGLFSSGISSSETVRLLSLLSFTPPDVGVF